MVVPEALVWLLIVIVVVFGATGLVQEHAKSRGRKADRDADTPQRTAPTVRRGRLQP